MSSIFLTRLRFALSIAYPMVRPVAGGVMLAALALSAASPAMAQRSELADRLAAAFSVDKDAQPGEKPQSSYQIVPPSQLRSRPSIDVGPSISVFDGKKGPQVIGLGRLDMKLSSRDLLRTKWTGAGDDAEALMVLGVTPDGKIDQCAPAFPIRNMIADYACAPIMRTARFRWDPKVTPPPYGYILVELRWNASTGTASSGTASGSRPKSASNQLHWKETWSRFFRDHYYPVSYMGARSFPWQRPGAIALSLSEQDVPQAARELGMIGISDVQVRIRRDGSIDSCTPIKSGASMLLDLTTCDLVMQRGRFTPAPESATLTNEVLVRQSFTWNF